MESYDVVVIGAGSGGMAAAKKAADRGGTAAVVESRTVGGTCVARGCMPKKFLVLAARKARAAASGGPRGVGTRLERVSWRELIDHEQRVVDGLIDANRSSLEDYEGLTLVEGEAVLEDRHTVRVGDRTLTGDALVLAVGLRPRRPGFPGAELGMTSDEFLTHSARPETLAIVGGGYVGVEFAGVMDAFGTGVRIFQRPSGLIPDHDREVAGHLEDAMRSAGVRVHTGVEVDRLEQHGEGLRVHAAGTEPVAVEDVLLAAGRRPNTDDMGLDGLGIEREDGFVVVDEYLRTSLENVYAVGDVNGHMMFTPVAIAEGKRAAMNALEGEEEPVDYEAVPRAVFSHPPIGSVGLPEREARERYGTLQVARKSFTSFEASVAGQHDGEEDVFIKLIYGGDERRLVGLHVMGPHAPELVQGFAPAMRRGLTQEEMKDFPGIHPTVAEEVFSTKPS